MRLNTQALIFLIVALLLAFALIGMVMTPKADAHRPPLATAQTAGAKAASWVCWNVLFPDIDDADTRCSNTGLELDGGKGGDRRICPGHNDPNGAWCFDSAYGSNKKHIAYLFRIRVTYACEKGPGGLPCVELKTFYSRIRNMNG